LEETDIRGLTWTPHIVLVSLCAQKDFSDFSPVISVESDEEPQVVTGHDNLVEL
jgi:hypothetical protein